MKKLLTVFIMMISVIAWADTYKEGLVAYERGDYRTAFKKFEQLAIQGNARAQFNLALMYRNGQGVLQDDKQALRWYTRAAEQGVIEAQHNLGRMYGEGEGVVQDYKQAVRWYTLAAEQGDVRSQHRLGWMYGMGKGVVQDSVRAHMWVNIAAANGETTAAKLRDIIASHMSQQQIERAQRMARECVARNYKQCN